LEVALSSPQADEGESKFLDNLLAEVGVVSPQAKLLESGVGIQPDPTKEIRVLSREDYKHRLIVALTAMGMGSSEVAELSLSSVATVNAIMELDWAQDFCKELMHRMGVDVVTQTLKAAALDCINTLISVMRDKNAKPSERINACNSLQDRLWGKPTQKMETTKEVEAPRDQDRLERELLALRDRQAKLEGAVQ
jgi:hypothetical protein